MPFPSSVGSALPDRMVVNTAHTVAELAAQMTATITQAIHSGHGKASFRRM